MIDELADLAIAATIDVVAEGAMKKHRWVRILKAFIGLLFFVLIGGLVYVTFKYS
ncbi:MAG: hypothetical protein LBP94_06155 [Zoogloeaceae bacterium]|jgi:hypothetical protein|nr:hypothetical protein [Zoogloeaceae bacterium]